MSKSRNGKVAVPTPAEEIDSGEEEAVDDIKRKTPEQLWQGVKDSHAGVENARATMVSAIRISNDCALVAGECLVELKRRTERGKWLKTLEVNCGVGPREAQRYMDLYRNREALDEHDPDWLSKYTLVEALAFISLNRTEQSIDGVSESRESRMKAASKSKKARRAQVRAVLKAKAPTTAQVKARFAPFHQQITVIQHAVEKVKEAKTLDQIESEAIAVAKECQELVGQCRLRREALKGGPVGRIDMTLNGTPIGSPAVDVAAKKAAMVKKARSIRSEARSFTSKA
jgi:hypothetical protein